MTRQARLLTALTALSISCAPVVQVHAQAVTTAAFAGRAIDGKTEVEKAMGRCALALIAGALVGAAVADWRRRGEGAALGAAAGGLVCAAMLSVANKKDKEYVRALQLTALNSGEQQTQQWQTADNKAASATISASNVVQVTSPKTADVLNCRRLSTDLKIEDQESSSSDVVCLKGDSWVTLDKLKADGIRPQDVTV